MKYLVTWGAGGEQEVSSPAELDALLYRIRAAQTRVVVGVHYQATNGRWVGMDIGVGHPERSFVFFNERGGGYAREPSLYVWSDDIVFDDGGQATGYHPNETLVRAEKALDAAREFVATGKRPTCVTWEQ
ncbi:MAG TPA: Imm1 family immunity protein [Rugosimonospora sp.]|nr:Imm1 family immunity protein [Rugosimonospora sp.]